MQACGKSSALRNKEINQVTAVRPACIQPEKLEEAGSDLERKQKLGRMVGKAAIAAFVVGLSRVGAGQSLDVRDFPDAPSAAIAWADSADAPAKTVTAPDRRPVAPRYHKYIAASQRSVPFAYEDKMAFGLRDAFSLPSVGIWILAGSWQTMINSSPNYGQSWTALGQRIGAASIRDTSETLLVDSVFAPLFHEDPRYYQMGKRAGYAHRFIYAVTRPLITRSDSQGTVPNTALLAGDLGSIVLTNAYYPQRNRGFSQTGKSFGFSLGAIALGDAFQEFKLDALTGLSELAGEAAALKRG